MMLSRNASDNRRFLLWRGKVVHYDVEAKAFRMTDKATKARNDCRSKQVIPTAERAFEGAGPWKGPHEPPRALSPEPEPNAFQLSTSNESVDVKKNYWFSGNLERTGPFAAAAANETRNFPLKSPSLWRLRGGLMARRRHSSPRALSMRDMEHFCGG